MKVLTIYYLQVVICAAIWIIFSLPSKIWVQSHAMARSDWRGVQGGSWSVVQN